MLTLLPGLDFRPTLDCSAELGRVLCEAKEYVPHGQWGSWLRRVGLAERTARTHMQVFRHYDERPTTAEMTIERFLAYLRQSRIVAKRDEREVARVASAKRIGTLPDAMTFVNTDCRKYDWTQHGLIDAIVTDPPWNDMAAYKWLASMAFDRLRDGGIMLVQLGTRYLPDVMRIMQDAGLTYQWCLIIYYPEMRRAKPTGTRFLPSWKPVLLYSKGILPKCKGGYLGDCFTIGRGDETKTLHDWQQSTLPFLNWLPRLVDAGSLVADPFAGSGTTGEVCRQLAMRWVGTELDTKAYGVALGRLVV